MTSAEEYIKITCTIKQSKKRLSPSGMLPCWSIPNECRRSVCVGFDFMRDRSACLAFYCFDNKVLKCKAFQVLICKVKPFRLLLKLQEVL